MMSVDKGLNLSSCLAASCMTLFFSWALVMSKLSMRVNITFHSFDRLCRTFFLPGDLGYAFLAISCLILKRPSLIYSARWRIFIQYTNRDSLWYNKYILIWRIFINIPILHIYLMLCINTEGYNFFSITNVTWVIEVIITRCSVFNEPIGGCERWYLPVSFISKDDGQATSRSTIIFRLSSIFRLVLLTLYLDYLDSHIHE